ncbi:MAG: hypothetical protein HOM69_13900 [Gammaproteobacteria bacterium]|jgi:hypothetical protein|nr:hypothetical protein [Gammaproteobacteria bacterium]MBT5054313.1 hypothetical protein [Gammaproteobacteria bacterium]
MKICLGFVLIAFAVLSSTPVVASDADELTAIKRDLARLMARVEVLEQANQALRTEQARVDQAAASPAPRTSDAQSDGQPLLSWRGDVRYRYEAFDIDQKDDRERNRLRARVGLTAAVSDTLDMVVGLASGSDDPVSSNQTLGSAGTTKRLGLDQAYFSWQINDALNLKAGKIKNVWFKPVKSELLWDNDYNPEGVALSYASRGFFGHAAVNWLESDTRSGQAFAAGVQAGWRTSLGDYDLTAGAGYHDVGVADHEAFLGGDDFFGNQTLCQDSGCVYSHDYEQVQIFTMLGGRWLEQPLTVYFEAVENLALDAQNQGWSAGFKIGKASKPRTWELGYQYEDLEADAVFGLTAGSDFGGGGTNIKGHIVRGGWAVTKGWKLGLTYFNNETDLDGAQQGYQRLQLDSQIKF